jgi:glucose dehydrogenase
MIDAVIQPNKSGFLFVFDRKTGKPVWPIEERPVPQSATPGEHASPTQPFPSRPPAFDRQGVTEADLMDFTPALAAEAKRIAGRYQLAPLFTPPLLYQPGGKIGALSAPGAWGSGNWNTGAFDPDTGIYYAVSMTLPESFVLSKPKKEGATIAYAWADNIPDEPKESIYGIGPEGLPLLKPPYGRITAFDMNKGTKLWMVANGDGPRDHPLLKSLKLPPLGQIGRPVPLLTRSLLFLGESSDALYGKVGVAGPSTFRAYDKKTGGVVWQTALPAGTTGGPVTYAVGGKQRIVVSVGGKAQPGEWIALGIDP